MQEMETCSGQGENTLIDEQRLDHCNTYHSLISVCKIHCSLDSTLEAVKIIID